MKTMAPPVAKGPRIRLGVLLAVVALGIAGALWGGLRKPVVPIPVPAQLGRLDPQVRDYLAGLVRGVAASPRDARLRSDLGLAFAVNDLWSEARTCFRDALALGDGHPLVGMYAAVSLHETGDARAAAAELETWVAEHPTLAPAWCRLGWLRMTIGEPDRAEDAYRKVTQLAPREWRGWAGVGEARLRAGDARGAIESLEKALELEPFARTAYHLLAQALESSGRTEEAARARAAGRSSTAGPMPDEWSTRALEHMRLLPDQFERADALLAEGRGSEAVARLREAWKFHPDHPSVAARLARAYLAVGQPSPAVEVLDRVRKTLPDDLELLTAASTAAAAAGRIDEALELAKRAVTVAPQSPEGHVAEANAWLAAEDDGAAAAALGRALERSPADVGLWVQLGDLQRHNLKQEETAWATYQKARNIDPVHPPALRGLAEMAIEHRRFDVAEEMLRELARLRHDETSMTELEAALKRARTDRR